MAEVLTGLDRIVEGHWKHLKGRRLGLLANQASIDRRLNTAASVFSQLLPGHLKALFGPQHGYGGEDQDNMIETAHGHSQTLKIPIFSLYGDTRKPLPHMMDLIDVLIIDLQDVGTRVYTFAGTMLNCLRAAAEKGIKVLVLDRPNPLGGIIIEGNRLKQALYSFVGPFAFPMRHGLTMGEMATIFNREYQLNCDLEIVTLKGWKREMQWYDTGLRWVMPSPNMPVPQTASVYAGQVIWEGTHISEGRGTSRPFEIFGAPYLDSCAIRENLPKAALNGCMLQHFLFRPTFNKWSGDLCRGFHLHIIDLHAFRPFFTTMALLSTIIGLYGDQFQWSLPPYEYEYEKRPIDLIIGDTELVHDLETGVSISFLKEKWEVEAADYAEWRKAYLLYS